MVFPIGNNAVSPFILQPQSYGMAAPMSATPSLSGFGMPIGTASQIPVIPTTFANPMQGTYSDTLSMLSSITGTAQNYMSQLTQQVQSGLGSLSSMGGGLSLMGGTGASPFMGGGLSQLQQLAINSMNYKGRQTTTTTQQANAPAAASAPVGSSSKADAVVEWAMNEKKKGITEKDDQAYISKTYSKGKSWAWCADFVSTAFENTPGGSPFGHMPAVKDILAWGKKNNKFVPKGSGQPQKGDIIIFKEAGASHTGIVTGVKDGKVQTVEGNTSDSVNTRSYDLNYKTITGYVRTT